MHYKKYTKQRNRSIQGLRSFKDTLPKNIKRVINKKGHIYSEILNNWKIIIGDSLFKSKSVSANTTVELLTQPLVMEASEVLKVQAAYANRLHVVVSILEIEPREVTT